MKIDKEEAKRLLNLTKGIIKNSKYLEKMLKVKDCDTGEIEDTIDEIKLLTMYL